MSSKNRTMYEISIDDVMSTKRFSMQCIRPTFISIDIRRKTLCFLFLFYLLFALPFSSSIFLVSESQVGQGYQFRPTAEPPDLILTYYSMTNTTPENLESGDRIAGDHLTLNATWVPGDIVNGTKILINATAIPNVITASSNINTVEIDTRALGNNATCFINVTAWLLNGSTISKTFSNVFLGNFFVPSVNVITPNGGEVWTGTHNITWSAKDVNADDQLVFEVHLSDDNGTTFQLLTSGITETWLMWDFSSFENLSTYVIEVRASDGIYESMDRSDSSFTAGRINPTETSTSVTTSTTDMFPPTNEYETQLALFIAAAIIASAFLSVVVYYQAKDLT